jgi:hypothetical protein
MTQVSTYLNKTEYKEFSAIGKKAGVSDYELTKIGCLAIIKSKKVDIKKIALLTRIKLYIIESFKEAYEIIDNAP